MDDQSVDCAQERIVHMLYERLGRPALSKTMNLVGKAAAEEIVQDVFAKLWESKMKFPDLKHAYAWVYKCCTNAAIDYLRNHNNSHATLPEISSETTKDLEQMTHAHEVWTKINKILTEQEAEVFIYRTIEGLSQDEVAEIMHVSRRTVNRFQDKLDEKIAKIRRLKHVG